jgi:hypothetical protein
LSHGILVSRHAAATEALFLFAKYVFEDLGYRRLLWDHHHANAPSLQAAIRFGFVYESAFRQIGFHKGGNKDLWNHSMLNDGKEWPLAKAAMEAWLSEENFDEQGMQRRKLGEIREELMKSNAHCECK